MRSTLFVFAVLGCWFALARPAVAKPKVAIVAFDGDKKNEAREMVSDAISDDVTVLGSKQVNRSVDDLGLDVTALSDKDLRKLGKDLEADAIIQAKLSTKGKDKVLHFKLFLHGKKAKGFKVEFGSLKSARFKQQLHDKLLEKLGFSTPPGDDDAAAEPTKPTKTKAKPVDDTPPPSKTKKVPAGDDDDDAKLIKSKPLKSKKPAGDDDDDASATKKKPPTTDDAEPHRVAHAGDDDDSGSVTAHVDVKPANNDSSPSGVRTANRDAVRFDVGPSTSQRTLSFNSRSFTGAPNGYKNSPVPGGRIDGEIYPFAFGNPFGIAAGLGLGGLYDQTFLLNATTSIQPGTKFPVTQRRYSVGPRFRVVFGHTETSPSLVLAVDYGHRTFELNRSALMMGNTLDLPDVDYRGYDPTLEFRLPLTPRLALSFGAGAILLTGAGPIQLQSQYGQASVTGGEGDLGFEILLTQRIGIQLVFEAAQIGFKFKGNGEMTNNRDGDPSTQDVFGASDRYLGAAATLAVSY